MTPSARPEAYLRQLRELPFVVDLRWRAGQQAHDAKLLITTPHEHVEFIAQEKRHPVTAASAQHLIVGLRVRGAPGIVFAPAISPTAGDALATAGVNFIDLAGNCHLRIGDRYLVRLAGRRQQPSPQRRGLGPRSYQVLFALLAQPKLAGAPVRTVAELAGVPKTVAADVLRRLSEDGSLYATKSGRNIVNADALLEQWLLGYTEKLRPKLQWGRFRGQLTQRDLEKHAEAVLPREWAWGGATAAHRLSGHYRSNETTIHLGFPVQSAQRALRLLPAEDGHVLLLGIPGPIALHGPAPHVAHPVLVYSELIAEGTDRGREAAEEIREQYLDALRA